MGSSARATTSPSRRSACTGTSSTSYGSPCSARSTCSARSGPMDDTLIGFLIVGLGMLVVLGVVFAVSSRPRPAGPPPNPPQGVHLPPPSYLPVVVSLAGALLG